MKKNLSTTEVACIITGDWLQNMEWSLKKKEIITNMEGEGRFWAEMWDEIMYGDA
jgi:hypothetical protein